MRGAWPCAGDEEEIKTLRVEQDCSLREHTQVQTERDHLRAESASLHARSEKLAATLLEDRYAILEQSHSIELLQNVGLEKGAAADLEKICSLDIALNTAKDVIEGLRHENQI